MGDSSRQSSSTRPVSRRGEPKIMTADPYNNNNNNAIPLRPTTSVRGLTSARPPSALSGGTATRLVSAMHQQPGTSSSNQRIGTAIGFKDNMVSERVLTQHGLSGLPTAQARVGTMAGMRQIKDSRYWQAQLQLKMDEIRKETERLHRERQNMDREKSAKRSFEKKVKEATKDLTVLQGKLSDMNIALDAANSNISRQQMQQETTALRERNEHLQGQLETAFTERQAKEAVNKELEQGIEIERKKMDKVIESMSPADQEKYRQLEELSKQLGEENSKMHEKINELINQKTNLETVIRNSPDRLEALRLLMRLNETETKIKTIKEEERNRLTPAQEREKLIAEVRENKQALTGIQHQIKIAEDALAEKKNVLQQIEDDLDEGSSERYAKYKELKRRDETMTAFMETFKEKMEEQKKKIEMVKNQITSVIEQVTMQGINLRTLGITKVSILNEKNDLSSEDGLLKEYKRLSIQLKQLQLLEKRSVDQIENLKREERTTMDDFDKFSNLDALRTENARKMEQISTQLDELKHKKRVTEDVVEEAERRNNEIKDQLKSNESFRQISHLEEKLADLTEEAKTMQETLDQLKKEYDFSDIKADSETKLYELSELLRSSEKPFIQSPI